MVCTFVKSIITKHLKYYGLHFCDKLSKKKCVDNKMNDFGLY